MTPAGSSEDHSSWWSATPRLIHSGPRRPSMSWLAWAWLPWQASITADRKSTRLNSSHSQISYAVFCLKKKKNKKKCLIMIGTVVQYLTRYDSHCAHTPD